MSDWVNIVTRDWVKANSLNPKSLTKDRNPKPDSPIRSPLLVHQSVGTDVLAFCDAGVQTDCETPAPTSPRLDQPATLRDVRNELRALLIGLGF
jgi:hypothetical protein